MQSNEVEILCPNCGEPVPLTEALAAPLLDATRAEYERKLKAQTRTISKQQVALEEKERIAEETSRKLAKREANFEQEVSRQADAIAKMELAEKLSSARKAIADEEKRRAESKYSQELESRDRDTQAQAERIEKLTAKLTEAQQAQIDLKRKEVALEDLRRELPIKIEEEVGGRLEQVRATATADAERRLGLQMSDKDRKIQQLRTDLEEATRKAQQGSQQSQGETLELLLEDQLRRAFPSDAFQPVPKGEFGGDTLHIVRDTSGRDCGRILWEFKRTKDWRGTWLPKLRSDQRAAQADLAVIVSQAMPPDVQHFNEVDGVWVSSLSCTLPVAAAMRSTLLLLGSQRRSAEGQLTKSELVYAYLTGPRFRGRIQAIAERWTEMQKDLADEKKSTMKRWAKRELQLQTLIESTSGIHGDLEGIAGSDIKEIEALGDTLLLSEPATSGHYTE